MQDTTPRRRTLRRGVAALGALALSTAGVGVIAAPSQAAPADVQDVVLQWGLNIETGGGAYFGGCNFLSAGASGDAGSSRVWTEADGLYTPQSGNTQVLKPGADGSWVEPTWADKCKDANGNTVNTSPASSTQNIVQLSGGAGTVDVGAGTAEVTWDAEFTVVFYGGMTYWIASDPVLTVDADGSATLTATGSGWGAAMEDPSKWVELEPTEITLANLTGVEVDADGFTVTPEYLGVEVEPENGSPQVRTGDFWGSFPQDFVDWHWLTGQSSYWYSSGGQADVKKSATPLQVGWNAGAVEPEPEPEPGEGEVVVDVALPQVEPEPEPEPGEFSWALSSSSASLGTATQTEDGFAADGSLPTVTVTDTRTESGGWSFSGVASQFVDGEESFDAGALGWAPTASGDAAGLQVGQAVAPGAPGLGTAQTLAAAQGAGVAELGAALSLLAPLSAPAGDYSSTITITALSE